jgi:hypothetical protein
MIEVQHGTLREAGELLKEGAVLEKWARRWENRGDREASELYKGAAALEERLAKRHRGRAIGRKPPEIFRLAARQNCTGALFQIHRRRFREAAELLEEGNVMVEWAARWESRQRRLLALLALAVFGIALGTWALWPHPSPARPAPSHAAPLEEQGAQDPLDVRDMRIALAQIAEDRIAVARERPAREAEARTHVDRFGIPWDEKTRGPSVTITDMNTGAKAGWLGP